MKIQSSYNEERASRTLELSPAGFDREGDLRVIVRIDGIEHNTWINRDGARKLRKALKKALQA